MHYGSIKICDCANGPGMRTSLFVSGCPHHCKGCFNEVTWDYDYGEEFTNKTISYILESLYEPNVQGLSILGGEPLDSRNQEDVASLIIKLRMFFGEGRDIWLYTGYTWENLPVTEDLDYILKYVNVIVDGPFIEAEKDISLKFRGSRNQRIIDVKKTLKEGKVVEYEV